MRRTRNSQIGEFYVLQPPQVPPDVGKEKFTCDILIYDEESDRHVRITWGQALDACCINTANNANRGIARNVSMSHPTTGPQGMDANGATAAQNGGNHGATAHLSAWLAKAEDIRSFNEQAQGNTITYANIDTDIRIVVARPFIEHLMHSVIMTKSGRETGATLCVSHGLEPRPRALAAHAPRPCSGSARRTCS